MEQVFLLGRILFGGFFVYNGLNHFLNLNMMAQYAGSKGLPAPELAVAATGMLLLFGGVSVLLGLWPRLGLLAVVLFLVVVSVTMHNFWALGDPARRMNEMVQFTKNIALAGAALALMAVPEPWPLSVARNRQFLRSRVV
jgi:putative oxidoreductase